MDEKLRGQGIGSAILNAFREEYADKKFVVEIERADEGAGEEAVRRKELYLSNGMRSAGCIVDVFGVEMELLCFEQAVGFSEYRDFYRNVFSDWVAGNIRLVSGGQASR